MNSSTKERPDLCEWWRAQHRRGERLPEGERIRYDFDKRMFYVTKREVQPKADGSGYERRPARYYFNEQEALKQISKATPDPQYLHALTQAFTEAVSEEEELQRIIDFFNEEPDSVKAAMSALGAVGGKVKSAAKARAARANGKRGGRPKKK